MQNTRRSRTRRCRQEIQKVSLLPEAPAAPRPKLQNKTFASLNGAPGTCPSSLRLQIHRQKLIRMSIDELIKRQTNKISEISRLVSLARVTNQPFIKYLC